MTSSTLILKIIESNGSLSMLRDRGLSHSQIALLIQNHQQEGNVTITEEGIFLTEQGKQLLEKYYSESSLSSKEAWIVKQEHYYREPIPASTVVLPKKRKL